MCKCANEIGDHLHGEDGVDDQIAMLWMAVRKLERASTERHAQAEGHDFRLVELERRADAHYHLAGMETTEVEALKLRVRKLESPSPPVFSSWEAEELSGRVGVLEDAIRGHRGKFKVDPGAGDLRDRELWAVLDVGR